MRGSIWWRIAWRDLGRNRRRTLITASALALAFVGAVVMIAIYDGITAELIDNGTGLLSGQVQVHAADWRPERSLYATIGGAEGTDVAALVARVAGTPGVSAAAPRAYGGGILSAGAATEAAVLMGVDPAREVRVSRLLGALVAGRVPREGAKEVAIGTEMARKLGARPGTELVLVAPAADGSMGNDLFTVAGVFHSGLGELDGAYAVLPLGARQDLLALGRERIHEVAVAVPAPWAAAAAADAIRGRLAPLGLPVAVEPWPVFSPEIADYAQISKAANGLVVGIVFLFAIFGVANTILMGTFERRREFAVIRAMGVGPSGVVRTVVYEGIALGVLSLAAGAVLAAPLLVWWHHSPPNLAALFGDLEMAGALIRPVLRVEYSVDGPVYSAVGLFITSVLAALYPAFRAARVPPADALAGR